MKFKHMAVVAAAAVVGPTVLMATPAMADEARNPAVTTPDAAPKDDTGEELPSAPELSLTGLPEAGFKAGGDWQRLALRVDNSGRDAIAAYDFTLFLFSDDGPSLVRAEHFDIEVWNGTAWVPVAKDPDGHTAGTTDLRWAVGEDAAFDIQLRIRATADAPAGPVVVVLYGNSNGSEHPVASDMVVKRTSIHTASTGGGTGTGNGTGTGTGTGTGNGTGTGTSTGNGTGTGTGTGTDAGGEGATGGNQPAPNGGAEPVGTPGGQLAQTGGDPATSWTLGASGAALALGAALVAGTGRRRRPTS